jgi:hypothetical protein
MNRISKASETEWQGSLFASDGGSSLVGGITRRGESLVAAE